MATHVDRFAYVFNTTALGIGILMGLWLTYQGLFGGHGVDYLWRAAVIFFILVPLFFRLQARYGPDYPE